MAGLVSETEEEPQASGEAPEPIAEQSNQEQQQQQEVLARPRQTENEVSEVEIPNVGRIMVRADADGYNEEVRPNVLMECDLSSYKYIPAADSFPSQWTQI